LTGQAWLHVPQFAESVLTLTHTPAHSVVGALHTQEDCVQSLSDGQTLSHAPQFASSFARFTHVPLHGCTDGFEGSHQQTPPEHDCPATQAWPHAPQFALLH
jgi:hypothetical protein